jgi:hypothetical protein
MPLPTFDTLEDVPEAFRSEYELVDGRAVSKDIARLTGALAKERAEREAAAKSLRDAEKRAAELEMSNKARTNGISEEKLAELRAEIARETAPLEQERDALRAKLRTLQLDGSVKSLMAETGVRAERIDTLWTLVRDRFDLTDGGTPVVKDQPASDVKKALAGLVKEYPEFFAAPNVAGGGAGPSAKLPAGTNVASLVDTNPMALLDMANAA